MITIKHRYTQATLCEFDVETLRNLFKYEDGKLIRKVTTGNKVTGSVAGFLQNTGKLCVKIKGKTYLLHRVIFAYHYGHIPKCIDHVDGDTQNNRIENLRPATHSQNMCNRARNGTYKKGVKPHNGKWQARIQIGGVRTTIGTFDTEELASEAYINAAKRIHGEFARW